MGFKGYVIRPFDPWRSRLCTCPPKYSFDPYTGCEHGCLYCYASSYIKDFYNCRPKKDLLRKVRRDLSKIPANSLISMSNSSDPYTLMEARLKLTRRCLEEFVNHRIRLLVITKGALVSRDIDLLKRLRCAVTMTITTIDKDLSRRLEPRAPTPSTRLNALSTLSANGIPVGMRLDPIIPFLNDDRVEELLKEAKNVGVRHVVASTFKPRYDSWRRMVEEFPEEMRRLERLLKMGERIGRSWYLPREFRFKLMREVAETCRRLGLTFACCREGFPQLHTAKTCDGSHLIEGFDQPQLPNSMRSRAFDV